ncbi:hypothetical protein EG68_04525 [Paragonimus skrjabini miyazakii]|uniref:GAS2-like protein 1 n=1 Tax=Paragonimus skrjabini miyazakii TaxID=59628 RepID=A0A8S9YTK3_9TREM|nr:hypothetical protein EG68_04525 [Paragonimus skrjabini miyazakii]
MLQTNWTTTRINVVNNRCSSLPPANLEYYNHVSGLLIDSNASTELSNPDVEQATYSRLKSQTTIEAHGATPIHGKDNFSTYVLPTDFNRINPDVHPVGTKPNKSSPSDCSVITDDDSGYDPTMYTSGRPNGSTSSITNSGPLVSDNSSLGFVNRDELLHVMTEDLVEWFIQMYPTLTEELDVDNFFDRLSDGVLLCHHAKEIHQRLNEQCVTTDKGDRVTLTGIKVGGVQAALPNVCPAYQTRGLQGSTAASGFVSRDNVSNFLVWCRQLGMPDSVLFESEDLVCRKNPRNVAICLLELARLGGLMGIAVPGLIQLEVEIDQELATQGDSGVDSLRKQHNSSSCSSITEQEYVLYVRQAVEDPNMGTRKADIPLDDMDGHSGCSYKTTRSTELRRIKNQTSFLNKGYRSDSKGVEENVKRRPEIKRPIVDMRSLDEIVRDLLSQCTCKQTFPMIRVGEGRYLFGDKCTQIFVRILRSHVMVRVGGGWDTLNHFLAKYDECRKTNPPNCRVPPEMPLSTSTTTSTIDSSNVEDVLASVNSSNPNMAACSSDSPIRGQGSLTAVKRSPPRIMSQTGPRLTTDRGPSCLETGGDYFVDGVRKTKDLKHVQTEKILEEVSKPSRSNSSQVENSSKSPASLYSSLKQQPQNSSLRAQTACISSERKFTVNASPNTASFVRNVQSNSAVAKAVKRGKQTAGTTEAVDQCGKINNNTKSSVRSILSSSKSSKQHGSNKLQTSLSKSIDDLRTLSHQVKRTDTTPKNDGRLLNTRRQSVQPYLRMANNKPTLTKTSAKPSTNTLKKNDKTPRTNSRSSRSDGLQSPDDAPKLPNTQKVPNSVANRPYATREPNSVQAEALAPFRVDKNSEDKVAGQPMNKSLHRGSLIPRPVRCNSASRVSTDTSVRSTQLSDI